jgi:hypothetical protein
MAEPPYVRIEQRLTPEQLKATGLDTLSPAQLSLLNQLLYVPPIGSDTAGRPQADEASARMSFIGLDDKVIKSRLKGSIIEWGPGTVFELENGQTWKVLKGSMKLRSALPAPEVEIVPGIAGRWFIHIGDDLPGARVYRTD